MDKYPHEMSDYEKAGFTEEEESLLRQLGVPAYVASAIIYRYTPLPPQILHRNIEQKTKYRDNRKNRTTQQPDTKGD